MHNNGKILIKHFGKSVDYVAAMVGRFGISDTAAFQIIGLQKPHGMHISLKPSSFNSSVLGIEILRRNGTSSWKHFMFPKLWLGPVCP